MPEGDTIHRTAAGLRPVLVGKTVVEFRAHRWSGDQPGAGETIESVEAQGKHLLVSFSGGLTLETHMKMTGSWHVYRAGERWRKSPGAARAVIDVGDWVAVCFSAPTVRLHRRGEPIRADLGPDLCRPETDLDEVVARIGMFVTDDSEVADVLLDQRIASGIGNIYKSEVCWFERVDPFAPIGACDEATRRNLYARAAALLQANLGSGPRTTITGGLAVYDRTRRPCRRCGTSIERRAQGEYARSTYWCRRCQPATRG